MGGVCFTSRRCRRGLVLRVHFEKAMNQTIVCLIFAALGLSTLSRAAQVEARADFSGDGLRSFYFAVGNYYQVPERQVDLVRDRALPPDEVPVAFFVAQRAGVNPTVVVDLRRRGMSWSDIALHFHFRPDIYYFRDGPPYGKAYGYWKKSSTTRRGSDRCSQYSFSVGVSSRDSGSSTDRTLAQRQLCCGRWGLRGQVAQGR